MIKFLLGVAVGSIMFAIFADHVLPVIQQIAAGCI